MTDEAAPSSEPAPPQRGLGVVARNLGWLLANRGLMAVLSIVYLGIIARTLGVTDFGRFALVTGASRTLSTMVAFQTWQVVVQYGVAPLQAGDNGRLGRLLRACGMIDMASAVVGTVLAAAILIVFGDDFGIESDLLGATLMFLVVQLVTIRSMPTGVLRLRDKFSLAALADSVTPTVRLAGTAAVAVLSPSVQNFLYAWAVAELLTAAAYWAMLANSGDLALAWRARGTGRALLKENPGIVRFALSTSAGTSLGLSTKQVPLLLVGGFIGPAAAGIFRLAFQVANALAKLAQMVSRAVFPEIIRKVHASPGNMRRLLGRMSLAGTLAALAILALVTLLGKPLLTLIGGSDYVGAYPVLIWLATAGCLELAGVGFEPLLLATGRSVTALAARLIAVACLFVATLVLMPEYGATGAAMGVLVGSVMTALLLGLAAFRFSNGQAAKIRQ